MAQMTQPTVAYVCMSVYEEQAKSHCVTEEWLGIRPVINWS